MGFPSWQKHPKEWCKTVFMHENYLQGEKTKIKNFFKKILKNREKSQGRGINDYSQECNKKREKTKSI